MMVQLIPIIVVCLALIAVAVDSFNVNVAVSSNYGSRSGVLTRRQVSCSTTAQRSGTTTSTAVCSSFPLTRHINNKANSNRKPRSTLSAVILYSTPTPTDNESSVETTTPTTSSSVPSPSSEHDEPSSSSYPIDLPSPLLLASSMILAIVGTGSVFDLVNDSPRWGFPITFSLATVSLTICGGLFWASILKAKAETEADDERYMSGR